MEAIEKVMITKIKEEIELTCKKCGQSQKYHPRGNKIPKRPKTQCQNEECQAWIYFDPKLLVIDIDQRPKEPIKNDQKEINKSRAEPSETPNHKTINRKVDQTIDQRPKTIKKNRKSHEITYYKSMSKEVRLLGRTIPLKDVRDLARESLEHNRNLIKGIKYYLNAWESRYRKYKKEKPNNFLIDEFESMQKTLEMLENNKKVYEDLRNAKRTK